MTPAETTGAVVPRVSDEQAGGLADRVGRLVAHPGVLDRLIVDLASDLRDERRRNDDARAEIARLKAERVELWKAGRDAGAATADLPRDFENGPTAYAARVIMKATANVTQRAIVAAIRRLQPPAELVAKEPGQ